MVYLNFHTGGECSREGKLSDLFILTCTCNDVQITDLCFLVSGPNLNITMTN